MTADKLQAICKHAAATIDRIAPDKMYDSAAFREVLRMLANAGNGIETGAKCEECGAWCEDPVALLHHTVAQHARPRRSRWSWPRRIEGGRTA